MYLLDGASHRWMDESETSCRIPEIKSFLRLPHDICVCIFRPANLRLTAWKLSKSFRMQIYSSRESPFGRKRNDISTKWKHEWRQFPTKYPMLISHGDREMKISNRKFIQRTVFDIIISAALRIQMHPAKIDRAAQNLWNDRWKGKKLYLKSEIESESNVLSNFQRLWELDWSSTQVLRFPFSDIPALKWCGKIYNFFSYYDWFWFRQYYS